MEPARWCSLHESPVSHIASVFINFDIKSKTERLPLAPVPLKKDPRQETYSTSRGATVDRFNTAFSQLIRLLPNIQQHL